MSELDEAWELALAEAEKRARSAGRSDIADYIALRTTNDQVRKTAVEWLLSTFTALAGQANREGAGVRIEKEDSHRFRVGNSTMVGPRVIFRSGVRALTIEAGWPRTPRDGIVRGGGLACATIKHLGYQKLNDELLLIRSSNTGAPQWIVVESSGRRAQLHEARIRIHLSQFIGED